MQFNEGRIRRCSGLTVMRNGVFANCECVQQTVTHSANQDATSGTISASIVPSLVTLNMPMVMGSWNLRGPQEPGFR